MLVENLRETLKVNKQVMNYNEMNHTYSDSLSLIKCSASTSPPLSLRPQSLMLLFNYGKTFLPSKPKVAFLFPSFQNLWFRYS